METPVSLAVLASRYQTRNTFYQPSVSGWQLILKADPRRYYVSFRLASAAGFQSCIIPGPVVDGFSPSVTIALPEPAKFRDQPAAVTGEWYLFGSIGETFIITEQLFLEG